MNNRTKFKNRIILKLIFTLFICSIPEFSPANEYSPMFDSLSMNQSRIGVSVIAILPISFRGEGISKDAGRMIAKNGIYCFITHQNYTVVEQTQLDRVIQEREFTNSDKALDANAVNIRRLLSADFPMVVSI